jgi:hypothetical protein
MRRRTFDTLMSTAGALLAVLLVVAGGLLIWAHSFIGAQVKSQLSQEKIAMPDAASIAKLENKADQDALKPYIGQQLTTGQQAQAFADHYIYAHMQGVANGQTYEEVSGQYIAKTSADPNFAKSADGQKLAGQRQTLFMGDTLRGLLLNAYAFWKMGQIALIAAIVAFVGAGALALLSVLGFVHSRKAAPDAQLFEHKGEKELVTA